MERAERVKRPRRTSRVRREDVLLRVDDRCGGEVVDDPVVVVPSVDLVLERLSVLGRQRLLAQHLAVPAIVNGAEK